ncbi:MAG: TRAP transporter large permease subunit [Pseudomonadales bacterium]|nr:TRAP transporter large permease subunit [Pseudomonadales bacterium]
MMHSAKPVLLNRTVGEWLSSLPMFVLLLLTLVIGTGEMFHGQLLRMGEKIFGDPVAGVQYFMMRANPTKPNCEPNANIDTEVAKQIAATKSSSGSDDFGSLFASSPADPQAVRQSVQTSLDQCRERHVIYNKIIQHITPGLRAYRTFETAFFWLFHFGMDNRPLLLLLIVFFASMTTTLGFHHITLRPARTALDFKVQAIAMVIANALLIFSCVSHLMVDLNSGVPVDKPWIFYTWITMFSLLTLVSFAQIFRTPAHAQPGGTLGKALLSIPIYAFMAINGSIFFLTRGDHPALSIYMNQMMDLSSIFLNLSLYIWTGMLLKQSRVVDLFLDILRPWKFSPEMLTYIILLAAAVPTAYTGASGIFVIAAGPLIYNEVKQAGGSRQFALAATAMSGSLGVVLRPCLLVVLIAALNKEVTTAALFHWGFWVFILTSTLFFTVSQIHRTHRVKIERPGIAIPGMIRNCVPVIPYVIIIGLVVLSYRLLLDTPLNEFTAPVIMPIIMLVLVMFDKLRRNPHDKTPPKKRNRRQGLERSIRFATNETTGHIGALIMLMALSLTMGGLVSRSGIMDLAPTHFPNIWVAMSFLVVTKVLVGMFMDPFGAVILVSSTLAPIAYKAGIDPVHFWMMVLVAFELGYLLPPVALNQLLTRHVVGEEEIEKADAEVKNLRFFRRYERWIVPVIVMSIGLVIVAFVPLFMIGH